MCAVSKAYVEVQGPAGLFRHNMGGNSSSRLDSLQSEDEVITVVKGIRLTDRVIDRMKESPKAANQHPQSKKQAHPPVNIGEPWAPGERFVPILPHQPSYASSLVPPPLKVPVPPPPVSFASVSLETPAPPPHVESPAATVEADSPLPSSQEHSETIPHAESLTVTSPASADAVASPDKAIVPPETTESITVPVEPLPTNTFALPESPPSPDAPFTEPAKPTIEEPVPPPPSVTAEPVEEPVPPQSSSVLALTSEIPFLGEKGAPSTEETPVPPTSALPAEYDVPSILAPLTENIPSLASPSKTHTIVNEEELRKQIRDELQKHLEEEMKTAKLKIQQQLQEEKAMVEAEVQAKAQLQIQAEIKKVLEREQEALQQSLKDAVIQERMKTEDERLVAQYYWMERKIQKVEEKEKDLAKQDILYRQQITRLEEKTAQFTRVTAESFKKGLEDTRNRFKRSQIKPVCSELQNEILKCYLMNTGKTLTCSNIASLYIQCVDNAKQNKKVSTGG